MLLVHDMVKVIPGEVIRMALLGAHYRQPLDWSDATVTDARKKLDRLYQAVRHIKVSECMRAETSPPATVVAALEDDLNTPKALAEAFELVRELNKTSDATAREDWPPNCLRQGTSLASCEMIPSIGLRAGQGLAPCRPMRSMNWCGNETPHAPAKISRRRIGSATAWRRRVSSSRMVSAAAAGGGSNNERSQRCAAGDRR